MNTISDILLETFNNVVELQTNICERNFASVVIPKEVKNVGNYAFAGCEDLTRVEFSSKVDSIAGNAFTNCPNLTDIFTQWVEGELVGAPWGAPSTATIHYKPVITATIEGVYTPYRSRVPMESIYSSLVNVQFKTHIVTDGESYIALSIKAPVDYTYDSLIITNGRYGDDLEFVEVPLPYTEISSGRRFYDETLKLHNGTSVNLNFRWNDVYGENEIANFIADQVGYADFNTNIADQLTFASYVTDQETGYGDMECKITLSGLPETTEDIELVNTIIGTSVVGNTGGLTTISETYTRSNVGDVPPLLYIKDWPSIFHNNLLQFIATTFEADNLNDNRSASFSTTTQFKITE